MDKLSIFNNIDIDEINCTLKSLGARRITFRKDHMIISNLIENDLIGIILSGTVNVVKYDYLGNRDILDSLEYDAIFGKPFSYINSDVSIVAASDCEVLFLDYSLLISDKNYEKIRNNINILLVAKISKLYEKVDILSKRSIKDKLLSYFYILSKRYGKKKFVLPVTYLELADYLSVDRSAMMREIKKLKDQKIILVDGKKITINN